MTDQDAYAGEPRAGVRKRRLAVHGDAWTIAAFVRMLGALVASVVLPSLLFYQSEDYQYQALANVAIGAALATMLGADILARMSRFSELASANLIVPVFAATWGVLLLVLFLLRFEYARLLFVSSFVVCVVWYYATHAASIRRTRPRIGYAATLASRGLGQLLRERIEWVPIERPDALIAGLDGLVLDFRAALDDSWQRAAAEAAIGGVSVYHIKQIEEMLTGQVAIEHLSENQFGSMIPGAAFVEVKLLFDRLTSVVALVILALPMLVVALAIRFADPGPALFRQVRMGYRGRPFTVWKFRTMRRTTTADASLHAAMTQADDDRVFALGRFLRRTRIDELPQIVNILAGQMSWIGPRPEALVLSRWYEQQIPFYRYRHIVRPGISGWAQTKQGHVHTDEDVAAKLRYDFYYIKYLSLSLDMLVAFKTVKTMLTGFGAR